MAYPTTTAGALYGNLSKIANSFLPMFDPETAARAEMFRRERELFPLKKRGLEADIGLTDARTQTEGFQQNYLGAQTGLVGSKKTYQDTMNEAQSRVLNGGPMPSAAPPAASGPFTAPVTSYSTGAAVGGPDEIQDKWTNRGYSATGPNLVPGVVAVNPKVHPHGTVFRDTNSGRVFIAADSHGNRDPYVIDEFMEPGSYVRQKVNRNFEVIGREKIPYGTTGEQLGEIISRYAGSPGVLPPLPDEALPPDAIPVADIPAGATSIPDMARYAAVAGLNPEQFVGGIARGEALAGGFDEARAREIALAQGILPSQTTAVTPGYQTERDRLLAADSLKQAESVAGINAQSDAAVADIGGRYDLASDLMGAMFGRAPGARGTGAMLSPIAPGAPKTFGDMQAVEKEAAEVSFMNFGVPMNEEGAPENDPYVNERRAWQDSYITARRGGLSRNEAMIAANQHHFGTSTPTISSEDGWFSNPSMPSFNTAAMATPGAPPAAGGFDMGSIAPMLQQILGGQAPQAPAPVTGAPVTGEAAVPATGPMYGPELPKPAGQRLGDQADARKREEESMVGSRYNEATLRKVLDIAQQRGLSLEDLAATAFAGNKSNDRALVGSLKTLNDRPGMTMDGLTSSIPAEDIRNAFRDAAAMQRAGIDPALIRQYIPASMGGSAPQRIGRFIVE